MKLLIIGGSGLLGTEIQRQLEPLKGVIEVNAPPHNVIDITADEPLRAYKNIAYDRVILLVGEKNQSVVELDSSAALALNIVGVANIVKAIREYGWKSRLVYISTGYVYKGNSRYHKETDGVYPCSKYAWSKLGGECAVRMMDEKDHLIVRCEFSKFPWHRDWAYTDQYTSREEITITASKIVSLVTTDAYGTYNVGGKRQSIWKYAQSISKSYVKKDVRSSSKLIQFPRDTSLDTSKYKNYMRSAD